MLKNHPQFKESLSKSQLKRWLTVRRSDQRKYDAKDHQKSLLSKRFADQDLDEDAIKRHDRLRRLVFKIVDIDKCTHLSKPALEII